VSDSQNELSEIARDPSRVEGLSRSEARRLWIETNTLAAKLATVWMSPDDTSREEILDVHGAAALSRMSESFLYENARSMARSAFKAGTSWRFRSKFLIEDIAALDRANNVEPNRRASTPRAGRRLRAGGVS
jgi:hypothetical protein